jgi:hypothetical protein
MCWGSPLFFAGALDVRATEINEAMKVAAVHALAELAREDVPDAVIRAYGGKPIRFGPDYIIPKPLDTRALLKVVPAVVAAAASRAASPDRRCPSGPISSVWKPVWGPSGKSCVKSFPGAAGSPAYRAARRAPPRDHPGGPPCQPRKGLRSRCCWETRQPFVAMADAHAHFDWTGLTSWIIAATHM